MYHNKQMPLLFIMAKQKSLDNILDIFNKTVQICLHKFDPGVFGLSSKFIFFIEQNDTGGVQNAASKVFELQYFQNSAYVTIAKEMPGEILFYSYDTFKNGDYGQKGGNYGIINENISKRVGLTYIWKKGSPSSETSKIFTQRTDFKGKPFIVSPMVWSDRVIWSDITNDYYGFEIDLLLMCRNVLNFTYNIVLPKTPVVFMLSKDKSGYEGAVADVLQGIADISIGDSMHFWEVNNLVDCSTPFDSDAFDLLAPLPKPISALLATFQPFQMHVWLFLLGTFATSVGAFCLISKIEGKREALKEWNTLTSSFLYCFGTLLAESVSATCNVRNNANATR